MKKCNVENCHRKTSIIGHCKYCDIDYCCLHRLSEDHSCKNKKDCDKHAFLLNKKKLLKESESLKKKII